MNLSHSRRYAFDYFMLGFPLLLTLLAMVFAPLSRWPALIGPNLIFLAVIGLTVTIPEERVPRLLFIWRYWYPIVIVPLIYKHLGQYIHLIFPHSFDATIVALETALLGQPLNLWIPQIRTPWLTEIMHIAYAFYWVSIPITAFLYWRLNNRLAFRELVSGILAVFFISYLLFIVFPVYGPRFYLADRLPLNYTGLWLTPTLRHIVQKGGLQGGAFPSSHVAVAVLNYCYLKEYYPRFARRFFLPAVIMLSLGTVYGQFHYLTDVIAGVVLGISAGVVGVRHLRRAVATAIPVPEQEYWPH